MATTALMRSGSGGHFATSAPSSSSTKSASVSNESAGTNNSGSESSPISMEHRTSSSEDECDNHHNDEHTQQQQQQQQKLKDTRTIEDDEDTIVTEEEDDDKGDIECDTLNNINIDQQQQQHAHNALANLIDVTEKIGNFGQSSTMPSVNKRKSTGRLAMITEKLAKKQQNGQAAPISTNDDASDTASPMFGDSVAKAMTSVFQQAMAFSPSSTAEGAVEHMSSLFNDDEDSNADDEDDEDNEDIDVDVDEDGNEIDGDDDVKGGFRTLGLMGNVAFVGEDTFKCPLCQIKLDSQHAFTLHIRSHNPNDHSNTCRLCGKTLSSASSLDRHMLIHSGERPFKCSLCGMAFTTNGNMHRHMRTHGHGQIGYTARGAKRRAKLLAQRAAKMAAAAAAGEPVDAATISKLKKTALEVSKSPQSFKRRFLDHSPQLQETLATYSNMINANVAVPASMEAAAAAAVAAAAAAAAAETSQAHQAAKISKGQKGSSSHQKSSPALSSFLNGNEQFASNNNNNNNNLNSFNLPQSNGNNMYWPSSKPNVPEKGRPGRKRKPRPYEMPSTAAACESVASPSFNGMASSLFDLRRPALANGSGASNIVGCPICDCSIRSKMDLHFHMATKHTTERLFCLDCGMISESYDVYTKHRCTASMADVVTALQQNPTANPELLFSSTNTSRLNFKSAKSISLGQQQQQQQQQQLQHQNQSSTSSSSSSRHSPSPVMNCSTAALQSLLYSHPDLASVYRRSGAPSSVSPSAPLASPNPLLNNMFTQTCSKCSARFASSKELKHHNETFCHECGKDCLAPTHYLAHKIAAHNAPATAAAAAPSNDNQAALFQAAAAAFALNAAFPGFLNLSQAAMMKNVAAASSTSQLAAMLQQPQLSLAIQQNQQQQQQMQQLSAKSNRHSMESNYNNGNNKNANSALMADMKPDLADIQSIINMARYVTNKLPPLQQTGSSQQASAFNNQQQPKHRSNLEISLSSGNNPSQQLRSPNRASDAGAFEKRGGDAQHQPESPASADSAAGALSASNNASVGGESITRTDVKSEVKQEREEAAALCLTNPRKSSINEHENKKEESDEEAQEEEEEEDEEEDGKLLVVDDDDEDDEDDEGEDLGEEEEDGRPFDGDDECTPIKRQRRESRSLNGDQNALLGSEAAQSVTENGKESKNAPPLSGGETTPQFRCESCRLSFKSMNAFRRHNRGHTAGGGHSHSCPHCPYKSLDKSTLIRHQRTHNGERPFQCAICKYAFTTKANCERHVKKRHKQLQSDSEIASAMQYNRDMAATAAATRLVSEKIFIERDELPTSQDTVCRQCKCDFHTNRELRAHLRVPNNPCSQHLKPFICTICSVAFNTRNNCVRHIIKQHPATLSDIEMSDAVQQALIDTGSCASSLSPNSCNGGGSVAGGSAAKGSLHSSASSAASLSSSESESAYGGFEDGESTFPPTAEASRKPKASPRLPLASPNSSSSSNASFAALCQVAVDKMGEHEGSVDKKSSNSAYSPLNLSKKENTAKTKLGGDVVLDLSFKTKLEF